MLSSFPNLVHAVKMEADRGFPQAATAHDTFWDFISLMPEATHMVMWAMSDRTIPRSLRMMEGFGVNTFRLLNGNDEATFVKFPWRLIAARDAALAAAKPQLSRSWAVAQWQPVSGNDPETTAVPDLSWRCPVLSRRRTPRRPAVVPSAAGLLHSRAPVPTSPDEVDGGNALCQTRSEVCTASLRT